MPYQRIIRFGIFALISILAGYLFLNIALAGVFVYFLTHPICNHHPQSTAGYQPIEQWLQTEDGLSIKAWYYPPRNGAVVMALGGMSGSLGDNLPPIDFLLTDGYGVLQVDSRSCAKPPAIVTLGGDEVYDATAGLDFLKSLPEVEEIGVFGFSMGGATVIRTAAHRPEIGAVVAEGNYANLGELLANTNPSSSWTHRFFTNSIATIYKLVTDINPWAISPIDALPDISPRPVYLIFGEGESQGGRAQDQFDAAGEPKTLWIVPQGGHGCNHIVAHEEYEKNVLDFFNNSLLGK
jgi:dipeptidyl aminopeptidase/acylaminoacyl peptidase